MQFTYVALLSLAALTSAAPALDTSILTELTERQAGGGGIGACESAVAAKQVDCINKCNSDAACILAWYVSRSSLYII